MQLHELSFAKIIILSESIAEVIINEDIEMSMPMVKEYHHFLLTHLTSPFSLLINKINSYTYDFDAQLNIANLKEIHAMAVVAYTKTTKMSTEYLRTSIPRDVDWNMKIYPSRNDALEWLELEQQRLSMQ